jgi:hypothetical protein
VKFSEINFGSFGAFTIFNFASLVLDILRLGTDAASESRDRLQVMPSRKEENEAKNSNKFVFSLGLHYLCRPEGGSTKFY